MKRLSLILLLSCCLAPHTLALEETADAQQQDAGNGGKPKALTNELDQFVREAISEGLLTPAGQGEPEIEEGAATEEQLPKATEAAALPADVDCAAPNPLDFAEFREFDRYQQAYTFQQAAPSAGDKPATEAGFALAKAYLALGLYSEAAMVMRATPGAEAAAYRKVAELMENRGSADVDYFRALAKCHDEAGIWLSVALIASDQDEGLRTFNDNLADFRKLPFQLRADITALAVPELDKRDDRILPVKLLADFSEDQITSTPQLEFAQAMVDLSRASPDADRTVRTFLNQPQFQEEALAALMRHEKPLTGVYEEILLGELMKKFGQTGNDRELAASLQFALQELSGSSHYQPIMDLASMPALQNDAAQNEIRRQFVGGISRDLASDNRLRNLAAINALISDPGILTHAAERADLYRSGAALAVRFGLASLTRELIRKDGADDDVVTELAGLEFMREDYAAVATWARTYPDNPHIALFAAQGAIRQGDTASLKEFLEHLDREPETLLALIEQDAALGRWVVPDEIYVAAGRLTDAGQKQRAQRVSAMRRAAQDLAAGPKKIAMTGVPGVLKRAEPSAEPVAGGAH